MGKSVFSIESHSSEEVYIKLYTSEAFAGGTDGWDTSRTIHVIDKSTSRGRTLKNYEEHDCRRDKSALGCTGTICNVIFLVVPEPEENKEIFKFCVMLMWQAIIDGEYDFVLEVDDDEIG